MRQYAAPDEGLVQRLPLPLAQLYRRAHNAKRPLERHLAAFYFWEASLKLLASVAIVEYAQHGESDAQIALRLQNLARPTLGKWWEFVRILVPVLAEQGLVGFQQIRELLLGRSRDDFPRAAGLDAALREALGSKGDARATVRFTELYDRLVEYRNKIIGHGALGQSKDDFSERMARALLTGVAEILGRMDVLAGRRLVYIAEVRQVGGVWLVQRYELVGESARRIASLELPRTELARLPDSERLYLDDPAEEQAANVADALATYRLLHPLLVYEAEAEEIGFLNGRRGQRKIEYLCYTTGDRATREDLGSEQRGLLASVFGPVAEAGQTDQGAESFPSEEPIGGPAPNTVRRSLGEFELLSELGRGGMGIVYRAWQPSLGRQVALKKLLHTGDTKTEARFRREIRALGKVDHPHLVKIFLSGADGDQWFYAMELVEGANLSAVCDRLQTSTRSAADVDLNTWQQTLSTACVEARQAEKPLSDTPAEAGNRPISPDAEASPSHPAEIVVQPGYVRHVVQLMQQVAEAAHALHEHGIIHRDIKPGNIMVTADGRQAVLMDLGLAQLADEVEGRLTRTRHFVGTLRYASPEQVLAVGKLDPRSDVYSLGATLWELLTLRPLFDATEQTPEAELMPRIQYEEPARLRKYHPGIARDLDAIVLKCLEKDPKRRYATAREFAHELHQFLAGEPVLARPVGEAERLWRWCRRNRMVAGLAGAVMLSLLLGTVVATFFALKATANLEEKEQARRIAKTLEEEARKAEAEARSAADEAQTNAQRALDAKKLADQNAREADLHARRAEEALKFLQGLFEDSDPLGLEGVSFLSAKVTGERLTAYDILERGAKRINQELANQPEIKATLLDHIGNAFRSLGQYKRAKQLLQQAYELRQNLNGIRRGLEPVATSLETAATLHNLGWLYHDLGDYTKAEQFYQKALAIRLKHQDKEPLLAAVTQFNLAWLLTQLGDFDRAEPLFHSVIEVRRKVLGGDHRDLAIALGGLASLYIFKGDNFKAVAPSMEASRILIKLEGNEALAQAFKLFQSGVLAREMTRDFVQAKQLLTDCRRITKTALGEKHIFVSLVVHELAFTLDRKGEEADAGHYYQECLDIVREKVGLSHPMAIHPVKNYARLLSRQGKAAEAVDLFEELVTAHRQRFANQEPILLAEALTEYGVFLRKVEKRSRAKETLREALTIYRNHRRAYQPRAYTQCLFSLADLELQDQNFAEAESLARANVQPTRKQFGEKARNVAVVLGTQGAALLHQRKYAEAERVLREALDIFRGGDGGQVMSKLPGFLRIPSSVNPPDSEMVVAMSNLVRLYLDSGRSADAVAMAAQRSQLWPNDPEQLYCAACEVAQSIPLVGHNQNSLTDQEQANRQQYATQALDLIRRAVAKKFKDVDRLRTDKQLDPLRSNPEFQKLLAETEGRSKDNQR